MEAALVNALAVPPVGQHLQPDPDGCQHLPAAITFEAACRCISKLSARFESNKQLAALHAVVAALVIRLADGQVWERRKAVAAASCLADSRDGAAALSVAGAAGRLLERLARDECPLLAGRQPGDSDGSSEDDDDTETDGSTSSDDDDDDDSCTASGRPRAARDLWLCSLHLLAKLLRAPCKPAPPAEQLCRDVLTAVCQLAPDLGRTASRRGSAALVVGWLTCALPAPPGEDTNVAAATCAQTWMRASGLLELLSCRQAEACLLLGEAGRRWPFDASLFADAGKLVRWLDCCGPLPPCCWDETDAASGLLDCAAAEESPAGLGGSMRHGQDVRLVCCSGRGGALTGVEALRQADGSQVEAGSCAAALAAGYSVAVRGLGFRDAAVAGLCAAAAAAAGPSALSGANLYCTPAGRQGLAPHYDDHTVLVMQLAGTKRWRVWPASCGAVLPRLRTARRAPDVDGGMPPALEVELRPGHILFIPRGWPHCAVAGADDEEWLPGTADLSSSSSSVHLTVTLEVEPPFDWCGALHVALRLFSPGTAGQLAELLLAHLWLELAAAAEPAAWLRAASLAAGEESVGGVRLGGFRAAAAAWASTEVPVSAAAELPADELEQCATALEKSHRAVPCAVQYFDGLLWRRLIEQLQWVRRHVPRAGSLVDIWAAESSTAELCRTIRARCAEPGAFAAVEVVRANLAELLGGHEGKQCWGEVEAELLQLAARFRSCRAAVGRATGAVHELGFVSWQS